LIPMNDTTPIPPPLPPQLRLTPPPQADDPSERVPVSGIAAAIESILRQPKRLQFALRQPGAWRVILAMGLVAVICALIYGFVVGTFSRGDQLWLAPLKIASGLIIASVICLPSLYIFACLSGSQAKLSEMAGLVAGMLMLMTLLLIGFAPVAWLFSESTNSPCWMGLLHLIFWGIATLFGIRFLGTGFAATQARSRAGLRVWAVIYLLVCLQLTAALRPIIGKSDAPLPVEKKFFIKHWFDCLFDDGSGQPRKGRHGDPA
jgi:hypothetical protein